MITFGINKYLGLVFQTPKGSTMNNTVPVSLEDRASRTIRFGVETPAALLRQRGKGCPLDGASHSQKITSGDATINGPFISLRIDFSTTITSYYIVTGLF